MNAVKKVLVVDDDPVIGKSFDRVLTRKGYLVVSAENGQEALNKIAKEEYDAVFTDIKMPGMDGLEVAERVRAKRPWTPVVIITGYGTAENQARAEAAGVREFLRKPLSPEMIEKSLDAAVATASPAPAEMLPQPAVAAAPERAGAALAAPQPEALGEESAGRKIGLFLGNVAMLFAAPFVALAYVALFPLIGLGMLAWTGVQAWRERRAALAALQAEEVGEEGAGAGIGVALYNIAMFFAAPFVTLTYIALFPLIGLAVLVWMGAKAWRNRRAVG